MVVSGQFNYTKGTASMPFKLPTLLNFQGSTHLISVGSFSKLFNEAPTNFDYDHPICRVRNPQKFAEYIVMRLMDDAPYERDDVMWSQPISQIFESLLEDYKPEFLRYLDD